MGKSELVNSVPSLTPGRSSSYNERAAGVALIAQVVAGRLYAALGVGAVFEADQLRGAQRMSTVQPGSGSHCVGVRFAALQAGRQAFICSYSSWAISA